MLISSIVFALDEQNLYNPRANYICIFDFELAIVVDTFSQCHVVSLRVVYSYFVNSRFFCQIELACDHCFNPYKIWFICSNCLWIQNAIFNGWITPFFTGTREKIVYSKQRKVNKVIWLKTKGGTHPNYRNTKGMIYM